MTDMGEVQRREEVEEVAGEQLPLPSNVTADPVDGVANEINDKEEVHPDEDMGELHRRENVAEEEEHQQLLLDVTTDPIDDVASENNVEYDKEEVHHNEEAQLKSLEPFSSDMLGGGINIVEDVAAIDKKTVEVFELETRSVSTTSVMVMEEEQVFVETTENARNIDEQGKISRVVEEREEERESGSSVQVIEFEYDDSQEEIELDLATLSTLVDMDKFYGHTPHCPNCRHRITKVILRKKPIVPERSIYVKILGYCRKCVTIVRTTVSWQTIREVVTKMLEENFQETDNDKRRDGKDSTTTVISRKDSPSDIVPKPAEISQETDKDEKKDKLKRRDGKDSTNTVITSPSDIVPKPAAKKSQETGKDEKKDKHKRHDGKDSTTTVITLPSDIVPKPAAKNSQETDNDGKRNKDKLDGKEEKSPSNIFPKPAAKKSQETDKDEKKDKHKRRDGKEEKSQSDIDPQPESENLSKKKRSKKLKKGEGEDKSQVVSSDDEAETETDEEDKYLTINNTKLLEILKCVVYGGLIESITSLSVVASVAATDATTLNVFAIGLALLFSGLIAFCFNLVDLKNDVNSIKKYKELLGRKKSDFLFHSTFAILSYVVFGLIAPTTYALAFRESDNKENKIIVSVVAAFACIFLLAIAKAHVRRETHKLPRARYVETTRYYLIVAFIVSGVAYAVGFMIEMLMLRLGLFRSVQRVTCYVPQMISATPTWASY